MFKEGLTYEKTITMVTVQCCNCGVVFGVPSDLKDRFRETQEGFFCPNGHGQSYTKSKSQIEIDKINNELARAKSEQQRIAMEKIQIEDQLNKANKKLKRVSNGVCPCCNRTFADLARHMKTKHSDIIKSTK